MSGHSRVFYTTLKLILAILVVHIDNIARNQAEAARAFYVFGDSLVDNGNNNYLVTLARADRPPYGIDYPTHRPTGRFSNGFNLPDFISQKLGSEATLPYLSPELTGEKLLVGANFASAGVGILNDTLDFLYIIRIFKQLEYFEQYQQRLSALVGSEEAKRVVNGGLVLITLGANDYVNNYFATPTSNRRLNYSLPDFTNLLITEYRKILQRVYELGARRVLVTGTGPMGCIPAELFMQRSKNGECAPELQRAANLFNPALVQMIQQLNHDIGSDVFVAANAFRMNMDFISNPQRFGFATSKLACCGQGPYNGFGVCTVLSNLCPNRDVYVFWDPFHPTERANRLIARMIMSGSTDYMSPMNLSTILAMDCKI